MNFYDVSIMVYAYPGRRRNEVTGVGGSEEDVGGCGGGIERRDFTFDFMEILKDKRNGVLSTGATVD